MADELTALFKSREWVKRRVDRVEFLDLTTVRRTIVLTLDLAKLRKIRTDCSVIPLGWFAPWANAGAVLRDGEGRVVPYMTCQDSDDRITAQIADRLTSVPGAGAEILKRIRAHRDDPGCPGRECDSWCR